MLNLPLLALLDGVDDGLSGLILGIALQTLRQVNGEHPDADAFPIRAVVEPESVGTLEAVSRLIEVVEPGDRALNFVALLAQRIDDHHAGAPFPAFLRADRFGAKLPDLAVLVNNERGEDRRHDGKYASDHGHKF